MKVILLYIYLFCFTITGCKAETQINRRVKLNTINNIQRPGFIGEHVKLTSVAVDGDTLYFWKEYDVNFNNEGNQHRVFIYNEKGKLIASPHYILIDVEKYKNKEKYYKEYFKNPFVVNVNVNDYNFESNEKHEYLITNGKKYQMLEYCPHDLLPTDKSKIPYYKQDKYRPEGVPEHAILNESANKERFIYTWKSVTGSGKIIEVTTYSISGKAQKLEKYELYEMVEDINLDNYSLLLKQEEKYFINDGKFYEINDAIEYKSLD